MRGPRFALSFGVFWGDANTVEICTCTAWRYLANQCHQSLQQMSVPNLLCQNSFCRVCRQSRRLKHSLVSRWLPDFGLSWLPLSRWWLIRWRSRSMSRGACLSSRCEITRSRTRSGLAACESLPMRMEMGGSIAAPCLWMACRGRRPWRAMAAACCQISAAHFQCPSGTCLVRPVRVPEIFRWCNSIAYQLFELLDIGKAAPRPGPNELAIDPNVKYSAGTRHQSDFPQFLGECCQ